MSQIIKRTILISGLIVLIVLIGVLGYHVIESYSIVEALYMTVITLSTVGYGEIKPLSDTGMIFTIMLIVGGIAVITTGISTVFSTILEGRFGITLKRYRMDKKLKKLHDHYIICGYGQVGHDVIDEFMRFDKNFVLIEKQEEHAGTLLEKDPDLLYISGNATEDETLKKAGIEKARGIIAVTGNDTDNLYICLSARALNPDLYIIARGIESDSAAKLKKAGADYVFSVERIGGVHLAAAALRPAVTSFLDTILRGEYYDLMLDEVVVEEDSEIAGKELKQTQIARDIGIIIPAIKSSKKKDLVFNPGPKTHIHAGDVLIVFGNPDQIQRLNKQCK